MGVKKSRALSNTVVYIIMTIMALIIICPVFYALCGSLKTNLQLMSGESLLPTTWEFQNFIEVWKKANFAQYTFNSLFICFFSTLGAVLLSSLTAFCIERCDFPGRKFVKNLYLMTMFIALGAVTLRPLYTLAVNVGIQNSLWPIILITIGAQGSNVFLVSKFIAGLPKELDEAAIIDGCGPFRILTSIIIPMCKPGIVTVCMISAMAAWNEYPVALVMVTDPTKATLPVGLANLYEIQRYATDWGALFAALVLALIPTVILFIVGQKQLVQGLSVGGVKG